jgi:hypothetical protein
MEEIMFQNLMLKEGGYPHLPDIQALYRRITELEGLLRAARIDSEQNRADATLYRHVRTLSAADFASIVTRNISGHGTFDDLVSQSLRKSLEKK